jgi:hypothetical protein
METARVAHARAAFEGAELGGRKDVDTGGNC